MGEIRHCCSQPVPLLRGGHGPRLGTSTLWATFPPVLGQASAAVSYIPSPETHTLMKIPCPTAITCSTCALLSCQCLHQSKSDAVHTTDNSLKAQIAIWRQRSMH